MVGIARSICRNQVYGEIALPIRAQNLHHKPEANGFRVGPVNSQWDDPGGLFFIFYLNKISHCVISLWDDLL